MELREWAEQIVWGNQLGDKLETPAVLTDDDPGGPLEAPSQPGRPAELRFKGPTPGDSGFPGAHRIENDTDRGRLLHFFANHELLATELMALVLLRFPDAPAAFRRGVAHTLKDEQAHTRWYVARMGQLGIQFGDLPVSGYFWRSVSTMETPMDFVSRLSLTFEQANLDYCRRFSQVFTEAGDPGTAGLLEKIYRDEIAHVAHGLKWFRRWKAPGESDWTAFCRQLKFPLSPARAKGLPFNREGRLEAGMTPEFIEALQVSAQSKGRTPTVWWFNPHAEGYIREGNAFTPGKFQVEMAHNLACLPQFLARADDIVLTPSPPRTAHLAALQASGFELPEFVGVDEDLPRMPDCLLDRKLGGLRPWAWSPDSIARMAPLLPRVTPSLRAVPDLDRGWEILYSKTWSAEFLLRSWDRWSDIEGICSKDVVGKPVETLEEVWAAVELYRSLGYHRLVAKQALGLAGAGALRLWEPQVLPSQERWMERLLASGQRLVIEPWLERLEDFSIHFQMTPNGLELLGFTRLFCDLRGQYRGNSAGPNGQLRLPPQVRRLAMPKVPLEQSWEHIYSDLLEVLEPEFHSLGYWGPASVDAFVYRDSSGRARLKPMVEINPRHTFGRLTLELQRYAAPGRTGHLRLHSIRDLKRGGFNSFEDYAAELQRSSPLKFLGSPQARVAAGTVCLNDPATVTSMLATWEVTAGSVAYSTSIP